MTTVGRHHKFYDAILNCAKWRENFYDDHLDFYDANSIAQWRLLQCDRVRVNFKTLLTHLQLL